VLLGISLIAFGILTRAAPEFFHPTAIWLSGIVLLLSVPFQVCVLPEPSPQRGPIGRPVAAHLIGAQYASVRRYLASPASRRVVKAPLVATFPAAAVRPGTSSTLTREGVVR
jgi:hypothetical protein